MSTTTLRGSIRSTVRGFVPYQPMYTARRTIPPTVSRTIWHKLRRNMPSTARGILPLDHTVLPAVRGTKAVWNAVPHRPPHELPYRTATRTRNHTVSSSERGTSTVSSVEWGTIPHCPPYEIPYRPPYERPYLPPYEVPYHTIPSTVQSVSYHTFTMAVPIGVLTTYHLPCSNYCY